MHINVTSRHMEVSEVVRERVESKIGAVIADYPQIEHVHVILDVQKFRHLVEVVVQGKNHLNVEAREESDDMYKSIDLVVDKIERQLRRSRQKLIDHKSGKQRTKLADFERKLGETDMAQT